MFLGVGATGAFKHGSFKGGDLKGAPEPLEHDLITPVQTPLNPTQTLLRVVQELLLIILVMPLKVLDLSWNSWSCFVPVTGNIHDIHRGGDSVVPGGGSGGPGGGSGIVGKTYKVRGCSTCK